MKILVAGANGYMGTRLIPALAEAGHDVINVIAFVRSARRLHIPNEFQGRVEVFEGDLMYPRTLEQIPKDIDAAYYLVHSMGRSYQSFVELEERCATNFAYAIAETQAKQIIHVGALGGEGHFNRYLRSQRQVEDALRQSGIPLTTLRAGIIIGSGSYTFEVIRDLVEHQPLLCCPRWCQNLCQPIAIYDVIHYLVHVLGREDFLGKTFSIGGPDVLSFKQMLEIYGNVHKLHRLSLSLPSKAPHLSALWLSFFTSCHYALARVLVETLQENIVCDETKIQKLIPHQCLSYRKSLEHALARIDQNAVVSSWKNAAITSGIRPSLLDHVHVPEHGSLSLVIHKPFEGFRKAVIDRLWAIGGANLWYTMDWAWKLRGFLDQLVGGIGIKRGRTEREIFIAGDSLDFWRVLVADKDKGHLLLYAELRMPGEAWLEWQVQEGILKQTATFRPRGLVGRFLWYLLLPFHYLIFHSLAKSLIKVDVPGPGLLP